MFQNFLNSLKTLENKNLIEAIQLGYQTCFEHIDISEHDVIIKAGTTLYHGTGESFDVRKIGTGGDNILWTADNMKIAKYYIPVAGSYMMNVDLNRNILQPFLKKEEPWYSIISKQLGVSEEITKFLIEKATKKNEESLKWYKQVEECKKIEQDLNKKENLAYESKDKTNLDEIASARDENFKNWEIAEKESKKNPYVHYTYFLSKYIATKMEKLFDYELGTTIGDKLYKKIIIKDNELKPATYQTQGTIVVVKPKRDLKLYNYAYGKSEGDLMDPAHLKLELFKTIESKGYDGIVIHDFAQSAHWGNYGHVAYGLFPNTIKDLDISSIKKQTHPINENQTNRKDDIVVLYRGEYTGNVGGQFYSPDKEWARQFTQSGRDSEIKTIKIRESDIYNSTAYAGDPDEVDAAIAKARAAGKRAVRLDEGQGQSKSVKVFDSSISRNL